MDPQSCVHELHSGTCGVRATGHTVGRPQTDGHQERGYEPKHRCSHQRRHRATLHCSDDGGDEDKDGANRVMKKLCQGPIDARHLGLQPKQVHEEEDEEGDEEPQRHHLEELECRPAGPPPSTVHAQEGDEQCQHLSHLKQTRDGPGVARVEDAVPGSPGGAGRGDDGVGHISGTSAGSLTLTRQTAAELK